MKEIAIIAFSKDYAEFLKECLDVYLGRYARLNVYSIEEVEHAEIIKEQYIVLSAFTVFKKVQEKIRQNAVLQVVHFSLSTQNAEKLKELPGKIRALLVNIDYRLCMEVITQIYEAGFKNLDLVPYYGHEETRDKSIKIAITPNEIQMVPEGIDNIIDIGERVIDVNCVIELADKMKIEGIFNSEEAQNARKSIISTSRSIDRLLGENENMIEQIKVLMELMGDGIVLTDLTGRIFLSNNKAKSILENKLKTVDGFLITDILPGIRINETYPKQKITENIIFYEGKNLIVSVAVIYSNEIKIGNIITVKNFEEVEDRQHGIRSQISGNRHIARYEFEDIKGESRQIKDSVMIGRRMSKTEASVFITGESGTGKEVFAQSIHNASMRRKYNFVAVNCAAIPESLLESEMFGYEEGAFTGAKKGGKIGFFELAHKGTIFLDEIGEIPMTLQSKLLRVLEERRVSRIGSLKLIDIDVRVIAATNRNVQELIEEKKFREDLYYRLNVLPLEIPGLRERMGDIPILLDHFMKITGKWWTYSQEAADALCRYRWPGNIRELRNLTEYISSLDKDFINREDLPDYILRYGVQRKNALEKRGDTKSIISKNNMGFILREGKNIEMFEGILSALNQINYKNERFGRAKLEGILNSRGYSYTEAEIRNGLRMLGEMGYIRSSRGRGGSSITEAGKALLYDIKGLIG